MQFTSFLDDGHLTVALTGEIDHTCAKGYISAIAAKIEAYTPEVCVLDFSEVTFMDSIKNPRFELQSNRGKEKENLPFAREADFR